MSTKSDRGGFNVHPGGIVIHPDWINVYPGAIVVHPDLINVHPGAINVVPTVPVIPAKMTTNPTKTGKTEQMNRKRVSRAQRAKFKEQSAIRAATVTERLNGLRLCSASTAR